MTDNEINVAIAEVCGKLSRKPGEVVEYQRPEGNNAVFQRVRFPDGSISPCYIEHLPDYANDWNAIHSAVNSLGHSERIVFLGCLSTVLERKNPDRRRWLPELIIESTPRDWCEGLLLAMGKWKGST